MTDGCDILSEIALRWISLDLSDDKSTLVQVMAWCHQAPSHYLNQCWARSLPLYGITRPQWVKNYEDEIWVSFLSSRFCIYLYLKQYKAILCNNGPVSSPHMVLREILIHRIDFTLASWLQKLVELGCLFNSSFRITTKKTSKLNITGHLWWQAIGILDKHIFSFLTCK